MTSEQAQPTDVDDSTVEFIRRMAFLRREFLGRNRIDKLTSGLEQGNEMRTIYFYDTNVLTCYCRPWDGGLSSQQRASREYEARARLSDELDIIGYGEPLPLTENINEGRGARGLNDKEAVANYAASMLAHYALVDVKKERRYGATSDIMPIVQFPQHNQKTRDIFSNSYYFYNKVKSGKTQTSAKANAQTLRGMAALLKNKSRTEGPGRSLGLIQSILQEIAQVDLPRAVEPGQKPTDAHREKEWTRFTSLSAKVGGIFCVSDLKVGTQNPELNQLLNALQNLDPAKLSDEEARVFKRVFSGIKALRKKSDPEDDAEAIALLFLINYRLTSVAGNKWRAVFVTGSVGLANACYDFFKSLSGSTPSGVISMRQSIAAGNAASSNAHFKSVVENFSQKYLRHLFAYTTEALLDPEPTEQSRFISWLDGALGTVSGPSGFREKRLTEIYRHPTRLLSKSAHDSGEASEHLELERYRNLVDVKWNELVRNAVATKKFSHLDLDSNESQYLTSRILAIVARVEPNGGFSDWNKFIAHVTEEYYRSRDRALVQMAFAGIGDMLYVLDQPRNPPDLAFEELPATDTIFNRLCRPERYSRDAFVRDFKHIRDDCGTVNLTEDDRMLSHLHLLVLGAAFASSNKWAVALSQGRNALSIVERSNETASKIAVPVKPNGDPVVSFSGREANFLCAVSARMVAKFKDDFVLAQNYLNSATAGLNKDKLSGTAKAQTHLRFLNEQVSINLAIYFFQRAQEPTNKKRGDTEVKATEEAGAAFESLEVVFDELARNDKAHTGAEEGRLFTDPEIFLKPYGDVTLANLSTNIIQLAMIQAFRLSKDLSCDWTKITRRMLRRALLLLGERIANEGPTEARVRETPLMKIYYDCGARLLCEDAFAFEQSPQGIERLFNEAKWAFIVNYERARFERLKEFALVMSSKSKEQKENWLPD